jgi:hypothetical protein
LDLAPSTVSGILTRIGMGRLGRLGLEPAERYERTVAVGSRPLFDEYERKVREIGRHFDPELDGDDARRLRRQMEAVCVAAAPPFPPDQIPAFTFDPDDDPIVFVPFSRTPTIWSAMTGSTWYRAASHRSTSTRIGDCSPSPSTIWCRT